MVYLFAFIGFTFGFSVGLGTINVILRHKSKAEIQTDQSLRWKYGLLVWFFAFLGGWLGVSLYNQFFF